MDTRGDGATASPAGPNERYRSAKLIAPGLKRLLRPIADRAVGSIVGVTTSQPVVSLTFDDGPDPQITPDLLELLARYGAKATFFVVGSRACAFPLIVQKIQDGGHEVALHGREHVSLSSCSRHVAFDVIWRGKRDVEAVTNRRLRFFRPPHGEQDLAAWTMARAARMEVVHWSADAGDWSDLGLSRHLSAAAEVKAGGVMLLHDGPPLLNASLDRAALLDGVLRQLVRSGLSSVPIGELLRCGPPLRRFWLSPHRRTDQNVAAGRA